jgi:alkylhydroperoxidase family enzyme
MLRGDPADRQARLREAVSRLVAAVLDGEGATAVEDRHAAFAGHAHDDAVAAYVGLVRTHADRVTDADIDRLRAAGLGDDAIFELTVAAALGAGMDQLRAGLSLLGREP